MGTATPTMSGFDFVDYSESASSFSDSESDVHACTNCGKTISDDAKLRAQHTLECNEGMLQDHLEWDLKSAVKTYKLAYDTDFWSDTGSTVRQNIICEFLRFYDDRPLMRKLCVRDMLPYLQHTEVDEDCKADTIIRWTEHHPGDSIEEMIDTICIHRLSEPTRTWFCNAVADLTDPAATKAVMRQLNRGLKFERDNIVFEQTINVEHDKLMFLCENKRLESDEESEVSEEYKDREVCEEVIRDDKDSTSCEIISICWLFKYDGEISTFQEFYASQDDYDHTPNLLVTLSMKKEDGELVEVARFEGKLEDNEEGQREAVVGGWTREHLWGRSGTTYEFVSRVVVNYVSMGNAVRADNP